MTTPDGTTLALRRPPFPVQSPTLADLPKYACGPEGDAAPRMLMLADHPHLQAALIARAYATSDRYEIDMALAEIEGVRRSQRNGTLDWLREDSRDVPPESGNGGGADTDVIEASMTLDRFAIGREFLCGVRRWRCTDIGTRIVAAILVDPEAEMTFMRMERGRKPEPYTLTGAQAAAEGWFDGPPYAVVEHAFDEYDLEGCEPVGNTNGDGAEPLQT